MDTHHPSYASVHIDSGTPPRAAAWTRPETHFAINNLGFLQAVDRTKHNQKELGKIPFKFSGDVVRKFGLRILRSVTMMIDDNNDLPAKD
ncbi:hypothetical protein CDAR_465471 [Caerostris darwini]|uniref:Uncharacterized protein n=1 Tax=Caerostris darwini TaxID=1538125 RepID=A0AAV4S8Y0_9ARAC|nr:hypothetical protein CDAR_465471 [Caerostris darwini]